MRAGSRDFLPLRMLAGLVVQPFVAAGLAYLTAPLVEWTQPAHLRGGSDPAEVARSLAAGAALVAFFVVMLAAVPILLWRTDRGPLSRTQVLLWGVGVGNAPGLLGTILLGSNGVFGSLLLLALGSLFGLVGAFVFWLISIRGTRLEKPALSDPTQR